MAHISGTNTPSGRPLMYSEREDWADVVPVPQYDGVVPIAPIFYSPECECLRFLGFFSQTR